MPLRKPRKTRILAPTSSLACQDSYLTAKGRNLTRDAVSERRLALSSYSDVPCEAFRILLIHRTLPGDIPQTSVRMWPPALRPYCAHKMGVSNSLAGCEKSPGLLIPNV